MDMKKMGIGAVAGGLTLFVLGWVIYGMVIQPEGMAAEPNYLMMGLSMLFSGALITLVLGWSGASSPADGFKAAALFGILLNLAMGFSMMGSMEMAPAMSEVLRDTVVGGLVMYGIAGAVVTMAVNRGSGD